MTEDFRTEGLQDYRTVGLQNFRTVELLDNHLGGGCRLSITSGSVKDSESEKYHFNQCKSLFDMYQRQLKFSTKLKGLRGLRK